MEHSRHNPSARYRALLRLYADMHREGEKFLKIPPQDTFAGKSLTAQAERIKRLIEVTGAKTLLDYGSGKGRQYDPQPVRVAGEAGSWDSILDYWGVDDVTCFDPAYPPYSKLPAGQFDGVISTDVMEHCPEEDIPWIVEEIFGYARRFVYVNAACFPARKRLPNGENAHCTIRPPEWWQGRFEQASARHPGVLWKLCVAYLPRQGERRLIKRCVGNAQSSSSPGPPMPSGAASC